MDVDLTNRPAEIRKGRRSDMQAMIDFGDYVFSKSHRPHDFETLLPKLYGSGTDTSEGHYLVTSPEDHAIRALIYSDAIPHQLNRPEKAATPDDPAADMAHATPADSILVNGIGTVSVHPRARGKGYMRALMHAAIADMRREGVTLSILSGQRQRYGHYGYEPAGTNLRITVTAENLRKYQGTSPETEAVDPSGWTVAAADRLEEAETLRDELPALYDLYRAQSLSVCRTPETFVASVLNWDSTLYRVRDGEGILRGYAAGRTYGDTLDLMEFMPADRAAIRPMLAALWDATGTEAATVDVAVWQQTLAGALLTYAEDYAIHSAELLLVLDWEALLRYTLALKRFMGVRLTDGTLHLCIDDLPASGTDPALWASLLTGEDPFGSEATRHAPAQVELVIDVRDGVPEVTREAPSDNTRDVLKLPYRTAVRGLLAPSTDLLRASLTTAQRALVDGLNWFPLPWSLYRADGV